MNKPPHQLNTLVSNRVTEINRTTKEYERKYVESKSNPADMLSRGVYPADLKINDVWWHGPTFLRTASFADFKEEEVVDIPDVKKVTCTAQECEGPYELPVLTRFSSFRRLRRVMAYVARFIRKARKIRTDNNHQLHPR